MSAVVASTLTRVLTFEVIAFWRSALAIIQSNSSSVRLRMLRRNCGTSSIIASR